MKGIDDLATVFGVIWVGLGIGAIVGIIAGIKALIKSFWR